MTVISAHEATSTRDCKTPGCTGEALDSRGPYALLCASCKFRARQERAQGAEAARATERLQDALYGAAGERPEPPAEPKPERKAERPAAPKPERAKRSRPPRVAVAQTFEDRVLALAELARRLDRAQAALAEATAEAQLATEAWNEALRTLGEEAA